jgi:DNA polymerase-3 subunit alpha
VHNSAAGSLLAYCLDITQVDPIRWGTLWERFLTRHKLGYPDIDNDWSDREEATKLLIEYFGKENVIPVSTFSQLQLRSLIKDLSRLEGIPHEEVNYYTSRIEKEVLEEKKKEEGFDRGTWVLTYEEAEKHSKSFREFIVKYPKFENSLHVLWKHMRGIGRHAGGVIVTENAMDNLPLILGGKGDKRALQTPWPEGVNFRHMEDNGFLKFDILSIGTLRMFVECIRKILVKEGNKNPSFMDVKNFFWEKLHPDNNPMTDLNVYKHVFWEGHYAGIFQFVKPNTQKFMRKMKPRTVLDIAVATSCFRPGPLSLGVDKDLLANRTNPENIKYETPLLEEIYRESSGKLIFQEQLQMIYAKLAGVPLDETDKIRKAFTKKDISNKEQAEKDRLKLRGEFSKLCKERNNITEEASGKIFDNMEKLVAYSFNKCLHEDTTVETESGVKKIKEVIPGKDKVLSKNGFVKVLNKFENGSKKMVRLKTKSGKELLCTLDHKLETPFGMKTVSEILEKKYKIIVKE